MYNLSADKQWNHVTFRLDASQLDPLSGTIIMATVSEGIIRASFRPLYKRAS
jgi:hypothetical protein